MLVRREVLAGIATLPLAGSAFADSALIGRSCWDDLTKRGLYLPLLHEARGFKARGLQIRAQIFALVGDEDAAFRTMTTGGEAAATAPDLTGAQSERALDAIAREARTRQIVILNEAHHISRCRAFALEVALLLRSQGFEVFAAEALNDDGEPNAAKILNSGGPVTTNFGLYPDDPVYAELMRGAGAAGYRFAAYEARYDQMSGEYGDAAIVAREDAEADNFVANILKANPLARVFVYCGYDHVRKTPQRGVAWFAARLKAKTGIDPLCITQTAGVPPPDPALENAALKAILDHFDPQEPIVISDGQGHPVVVSEAMDPAPFDGSVDLSVFHPRLPYVAGRPGWLAKAPGRKAAPYRFAMPASADGLLQAIPAAAAMNANAVPADQFPVRAGTHEAMFLVKYGDYEVRFETNDGRRALGTLMA
ncbi:MAG TPA: hypothetical protein VGG36_02400 [Rhizomicrobium sp.]|jgi:hypothetical protein